MKVWWRCDVGVMVWWRCDEGCGEGDWFDDRQTNGRTLVVVESLSRLKRSQGRRNRSATVLWQIDVMKASLAWVRIDCISLRMRIRFRNCFERLKLRCIHPLKVWYLNQSEIRSDQVWLWLVQIQIFNKLTDGHQWSKSNNSNWKIAIWFCCNNDKPYLYSVQSPSF